MHLSERDVRNIASYTRIRLGDEDVAAMTTDLNNIIESLGPITKYELEGVEPTYHPIAGLSNVMRDDVTKPSMPRDEALENAGATEDGQFIVPPILGDTGGES